MIDLFEINHLCQFYMAQYEIKITVKYNNWGNYMSIIIRDYKFYNYFFADIPGEKIDGNGVANVNQAILYFLAHRNQCPRR